MADIEHLGALVAGGLLLAAGYRRGGAVGGVLKLAGLGMVFRGQQGYRRLYDLLGICLASKPTGVGRQSARIESEVLVHRSRQEIYRIWRNLSNLPVFMDHLVSVHELDDTRSLWTASAPAGTVIKWEAEIINDIEDELIAWQSLEGSGVDNAGSVRFSDAGDGATRVRVVLRYDPPGDFLGIKLGQIFGGNPQTQIDNDLLKFKAIMELGREAVEAPAEKRRRKPVRAEAL